MNALNFSRRYPPPQFTQFANLRWQFMLTAATGFVFLTNSSIFLKRANQAPFFVFPFLQSYHLVKFSEHFHEKNLGWAPKKCVFSPSSASFYIGMWVKKKGPQVAFFFFIAVWDIVCKGKKFWWGSKIHFFCLIFLFWVF